MQLLWFRIYSYLSYLSRAKGSHSLHSPFLFDLFNEVIGPAKSFQLTNVERLRKQLKSDQSILELYDLKTGTSYKKSVSTIARTSLSIKKFSSFLYLLMQHLKAKRVVETGTSLGINALYMADPSCVQQLITIEASPTLAAYARKQFTQLFQHKIESIEGTIQDTFRQTIIRVNPEVCFLDADHRSSEVIRCIDSIMSHTKNIKCIVVHDIYWSKDMMKGWEQIKADKRFALTVDLYQAGLIFPHLEMPKQHFTLRF